MIMDGGEKTTDNNRIMAEAEIRAHAEELAGKMNLRLICEMPLSDSYPVLWVENICVTDIKYPLPAEEKEDTLSINTGFFRKIFSRHRSASGQCFLKRLLGHVKRVMAITK
jgi:hypothetical protein